MLSYICSKFMQVLAVWTRYVLWAFFQSSFLWSLSKSTVYSCIVFGRLWLLHALGSSCSSHVLNLGWPISPRIPAPHSGAAALCFTDGHCCPQSVTLHSWEMQPFFSEGFWWYFQYKFQFGWLPLSLPSLFHTDISFCPQWKSCGQHQRVYSFVLSTGKTLMMFQ